MDFDPDKFLAQNDAQPSSGFDPDAFLGSGSNKGNRDDVIEEMHPDLSMGDRFIVKSFSNDPNAAADFLRKRKPHLEVKTANNRILVRGAKDQGWRPLDPDADGFDGMKEFGRDAVDLAWDVGSGAIEGLGMAGGAIAGTTLAGPVGTVPGGMIGSGLASSANEYLRQKIGEKLGVNKDVDGSQVAMSGTIGTVLPGVLGIGGVSKGTMKAAIRNAAMRGEDATTPIAKQLLKEKLAKSSRGLGMRAIDSVPAITSFISGVPKTAVENYANKADYYDQLGDDAFREIADKTTEGVKSGIQKGKKLYGDKLQDAIENAQEKVSLRNVKNSVRSHGDDLDSYAELASNPTIEAEKKAAKETYDSIFGLNRDEWIDIPENELADTEKLFMDHFVKTYDGPNGRNLKSTTPILPDGFRIENGKLQKVINKTEVDDDVSAKAAFKMQDWLRDQANFSALNKNSLGSRHAGNATRAEMNMADSAGDAYRQLNDEFERVTDGLSKEAKDGYSKYMNIQRELEPAFKNNKATFNTLGSLDTRSRKMVYGKLQQMQKDPELAQIATDVINNAKDIETMLYLYQPKMAPISSGGTTSTSRSIPLTTASGSLGALLGYKLGGGYTGAAVGGGLGASLGNVLGSPAMVKILAKRGHSTKKIAKFLESMGVNSKVAPGLNQIMSDNSAE